MRIFFFLAACASIGACSSDSSSSGTGSTGTAGTDVSTTGGSGTATGTGTGTTAGGDASSSTGKSCTSNQECAAGETCQPAGGAPGKADQAACDQCKTTCAGQGLPDCDTVCGPSCAGGGTTGGTTAPPSGVCKKAQAAECDKAQCQAYCENGGRCLAAFTAQLPNEQIQKCKTHCEENCGNGIFDDSDRTIMDCTIKLADQGCNGERVSGKVTECCKLENIQEICPK